MNNIKEVADSLNLGIEFKEENGEAVANIDNSNEFQLLYNKLSDDNTLNMLDDESDINLFGTSFTWSKDDDYKINLSSDYEKDIYRLKVWKI